MTKKLIVIEEDYLKQLIHDSCYYTALSSGGVDNWDCYDWSIADFVDVCNTNGIEDFDMDDCIEACYRDYLKYIDENYTGKETVYFG